MPNSAGERIRLARKRKGWTQKDLAMEVGCSQQTIVDIESQEHPKSRFMSVIVRVLGESLEWIETGIGGPSGNGGEAARLPHYDLETAALRALDPDQVDNAIDSMYASPVEMSRTSFTAGADKMTADVMSGHVREDDVLFVDPQAEPFPGRLVLVVMPGWDRAELRLLQSVGGRHFLQMDSTAFGDPLTPCIPYRGMADYLAHDDTAANDAPDPALLVGTVVFLGHDV